MTRDRSRRDPKGPERKRRIRRAPRPKTVSPPPGERDADEPFALASLPFDVYQRHKMVQAVVERIREGRSRLSILDVGGAPGHLRSFLPRDQVVVVDREMAPGASGVRGDGTRLPFGDESFDVVLSADVLPLVAPQKRRVLLHELVRVTGDVLLVASPFAAGPVSEAESILRTFLARRAGKEPPVLSAHAERGLPDRERSRRSLARLLGPVVVLPNGHLNRWLLMTALTSYLETDPKMADLRRQVSAFYNRGMYARDNAEPAYRHFLVARRRPAEPLDPDGLVAEAEGAPAVDFAPVAALMAAADIDLLREAYAAVAKLQEVLGDKDVQAAKLVAQRDHRQRVIDELQRELVRRQERIDELQHRAGAATEALRQRERLEEAVARGERRIVEMTTRVEEERRAAASLREQLGRFADHAASLDKLLSRSREHGDGLASHARSLEEMLDRKDRDARELATHAENLSERMRFQLAEHSRQAQDLTALLRRQSDGIEPRIDKLLGEVARVTEFADAARTRDEGLQRLREEASRAEAERDEQRERADELGGRVEALLEEREAARLDYERLAETLAARGNRIAGLERHAENLQAAADRRAARVRAMEDQVTGLKALAERAREHHAKSTEKLERERAKLATELAGSREVQAAREKRVKALESHTRILEERGSRLARQIAVLRKVVDTRQQMLGELNAQADRFQRESATLRGELDAVRESARASAVELGARHRDLDDARRRIEGQLRAASGLKNQLERAERQVAERDRAALEHSARLGVLAAAARKQEAEIERKDRQVSELRRESASLEAHLEEQRDRALKLEDALRRAEQAVEVGRRSLQERSRRAAELARRLRTLEERPPVRLLRRLGLLPGVEE